VGNLDLGALLDGIKSPVAVAYRRGQERLRRTDAVLLPGSPRCRCRSCWQRRHSRRCGLTQPPQPGCAGPHEACGHVVADHGRGMLSAISSQAVSARPEETDGSHRRRHECACPARRRSESRRDGAVSAGGQRAGVAVVSTPPRRAAMPRRMRPSSGRRMSSSTWRGLRPEFVPGSGRGLRLRRAEREKPLHAVDGPEQVHSVGAFQPAAQICSNSERTDAA